MYFLFRYHNMTPRQYKALGQGEKRIIRQFMYKELEEKSEERKSISDMFGGM